MPESPPPPRFTTAAEARRAEDAGIDILLRRAGAEGGGHGEVRRSAPCRCSTRCWTWFRCRCWPPAASHRREAWPRCWPPAPAERGWGLPLAGMSGGPDRPRLDAAHSSPRRETDTRHHSDLRPRRSSAVAGAVPLTGVEQRLRHPLDRVRRRLGHRRHAARANSPPLIAADDRRVAPVDAGQGVGMVPMLPRGRGHRARSVRAQQALLAGWGSTLPCT